jgi:hypothetical protein
MKMTLLPYPDTAALSDGCSCCIGFIIFIGVNSRSLIEIFVYLVDIAAVFYSIFQYATVCS